MTLNDLFEGDIYLQGFITIQCCESEAEPTVYYNGFAEEFYPEEYDSVMNREISYIFAENNTLCIEVCKDE